MANQPMFSERIAQALKHMSFISHIVKLVITVYGTLVSKCTMNIM